MKQQPKPTREQLAETWKDAGPGFEINGLGQLRTKNHVPGKAVHDVVPKTRKESP